MNSFIKYLPVDTV